MARKKRNVQPEKLPIKFDLDDLTLICCYVTTDNRMITRTNLSNVKKLFDMIDMFIYENNEELKARIHFITRALEARTVLGIENRMLVLDYCKSDKYKGIIEKSIVPDVSSMVLTSNEVNYVSLKMLDRLSYCYLYKHKDTLFELLEKLSLNEFDSLKQINGEFETVLGTILTDIRRAKQAQANKVRFSLHESVFDNLVIDVVKELKNPANILATGLQALNELLSGGFESKRFYLFLALTGGYKSNILLTVCRWIKQYNLRYQTKDQTKRPAVLLLLHENEIDETISRLFNMTTMAEDIKNFDPEEVVRLFKQEGGMVLTDESNVDIIVEHHPNRSICVRDIYTIIDELSDEGIEVIAVVDDYIERIRSNENHEEIRLELGAVVDNFKELAIYYKIPAISAMQLNRDAAKVIETALEQGRQDLARTLKQSNTGESWRAIQNSDLVCIIYKELVEALNQYYLSFNRTKMRYRPLSDLTYFSQPLEEGNEIKLIDDVGGRRLARHSLATKFEDIENKGKNSKHRTAIKREDETDYDNYDDVSLEDELFQRSYVVRKQTDNKAGQKKYIQESGSSKEKKAPIITLYVSMLEDII